MTGSGPTCFGVYQDEDNARINEFELKKAEALPGQLLTLMMGLLSGFFVIIALDPLNMTVLTGSENLLSDEFNLIILTNQTYRFNVFFFQLL